MRRRLGLLRIWPGKLKVSRRLGELIASHCRVSFRRLPIRDGGSWGRDHSVPLVSVSFQVFFYLIWFNSKLSKPRLGTSIALSGMQVMDEPFLYFHPGSVLSERMIG